MRRETRGSSSASSPPGPTTSTGPSTGSRRAPTISSMPSGAIAWTTDPPGRRRPRGPPRRRARARRPPRPALTPRGRRRRMSLSCGRSRAEALTTNGAVPLGRGGPGVVRAAAERRRGGRYAGCREQGQRLGLGGLGMGGQVELQGGRGHVLGGRRPASARAARARMQRAASSNTARPAALRRRREGRLISPSGPEHGEVRRVRAEHEIGKPLRVLRPVDREHEDGRAELLRVGEGAQRLVEDLGLLREHPAQRRPGSRGPRSPAPPRRAARASRGAGRATRGRHARRPPSRSRLRRPRWSGSRTRVGAGPSRSSATQVSIRSSKP